MRIGEIKKIGLYLDLDDIRVPLNIKLVDDKLIGRWIYPDDKKSVDMIEYYWPLSNFADDVYDIIKSNKISELLYL